MPAVPCKTCGRLVWSYDPKRARAPALQVLPVWQITASGGFALTLASLVCLGFEANRNSRVIKWHRLLKQATCAAWPTRASLKMSAVKSLSVQRILFLSTSTCVGCWIHVTPPPCPCLHRHCPLQWSRCSWRTGTAAGTKDAAAWPV